MTATPVRSVSWKGPGRFHVLPATDETVTIGLFDVNKPPVLTIESGDTVAVETRNHYNDGIVVGKSIEEVITLRKAHTGRGPHSVTGPIFVKGAEPGDVLEVRIKEITPKAYGFNYHLPLDFGFGVVPEDFPAGHIKYFYLDRSTMTTEFKAGVTIPLAPYPGILAVGPPLDWPERWFPGLEKARWQPEPGRFNTMPPGPFGGNMDNTTWGMGAAVFLPVFHPGALLWTGDSHAKQGDGEVNLTAIECAFSAIVLQVVVRKDRKAEGAWAWPLAETPSHWVIQGVDPDLSRALKHAVRNTIDFLVREKGFTRHEAYCFASIAVDYRVTQGVSPTTGVHGMIPKAFFEDAKGVPYTLGAREFGGR